MTLGTDTDRMIVVDGRFVSEKIHRIVQAIKDYEPNIDVQWLAPDQRYDKVNDVTLPAFQVIYNRPDGLTETLFYVKDEGDFNERVLQRIIYNDQRNVDVKWSELTAWEEAQKRIAKQAKIDEMEEAQDIAEHILKTHLNTYTVTPGLVVKEGIPFNAAHLKD